MTLVFRRISRAFSVQTFLLLLLAAAAARPALAQAPATLDLSLVNQKWTGDLDGMIKRRRIRVLTVTSKVFNFIDKDTQRGLTFDAMKIIEDDLNRKLPPKHLRVHVVCIPVPRDQLFSGLVEGRGDIAIANLTVTDERKKIVAFTNPVNENVSEIVVTGPQSPALASLQDLAGQSVFVRKASSYYESLLSLNEQFKSQGKPPVVLQFAAEHFEDEDLLEMLNAGLVKIVIADSHIVDFWKQVFPKIVPRPDLALRSGASTAWAIRKDSPQLLTELDAELKKYGKGSAVRNMLFQKYLRDTRYVKNATSEAERKKYEQLVSTFRKYGDQYQLDWVLMAAQGYQESRLNQHVKSRVGAVGVMQVMPATGAELKVGDIHEVDPNIHAGIKYARFMIDKYYKDDPANDLNKLLFTFASYNAGPAKIQSLRKEAARRGLDPNVWFRNVEQVAAEKVGAETVTYVSNIYKYYTAYKLVMEETQEKAKAKQQLKPP